MWESLELPGPEYNEFGGRSRTNRSLSAQPEVRFGGEDCRMTFFSRFEESALDDAEQGDFIFREQKTGLLFDVHGYDLGISIARRRIVNEYFQNVKRLFFRGEDIPVRENVSWTLGVGLGDYQGNHLQGEVDFRLKYDYMHRTDFTVGFERRVELLDFRDQYFSRNYIAVNPERFSPNGIWKLFFNFEHLFARKIQIKLSPYLRFEQDPVFWNYDPARELVVPDQFGVVFFYGMTLVADIEIVENVYIRTRQRIEEYDSRDSALTRIPYYSKYKAAITLGADWRKSFFFNTSVHFYSNQPDDVNSDSYLPKKLLFNAEFSYRFRKNFRSFLRGENLSDVSAYSVRGHPISPFSVLGGIEVKY